MALTPQEIFEKYQVLFADNEVGAITEAVMRDFNKDLTDYLGVANLNDLVPQWTALLTFQTDGTDDGEWCKYSDTSGNLRLWETKVDDNIGNEPPTDPGVTENAFWLEVSASSNSSFVEWQAGLYGAGLIIVFYNNDFYKLNVGPRPFNSVDIVAETIAGQWINITGDNYQYLTVTDANASDALVIGADVNVIQVTLDATLTIDWTPSALSGTTVQDRTYKWVVLKKSENGIDMSATTNAFFDDDIDPWTDLIDISTTQQRAHVDARGLANNAMQFGSMIITGSGYVE